METNLQSSEVRIPKSPQAPGSVCPQFKSSFARSLSFNTNTQPNKPLDFEISFRIAQNVDHSTNLSTTATVPQSHKTVDEVDEDFEEFMRNSPLKQSMQNLSTNSTTPTTPPTRKNGIAARAFNTTCSGRHRFQVHDNFFFFYEKQINKLSMVFPIFLSRSACLFLSIFVSLANWLMLENVYIEIIFQKLPIDVQRRNGKT